VISLRTTLSRLVVRLVWFCRRPSCGKVVLLRRRLVPLFFMEQFSLCFPFAL